MPTITYTDNGTLEIVKCWCGCIHAVPKSLREEQLRKRDQGESMVIYCPYGHEYVLGGRSRAEILKDQLVAKQAEIDRVRADVNSLKNRLRATRAAATRAKNRVAKGVCPCCDRYFRDLHSHIAHEHPEFSSDAEGGETHV